MHFLRFFFFLLLVCGITLSSCRSEGVCSGLNPEIGKFNTSKRLRKGGKALKSKPERESLRRRQKQGKKKGDFSSKSRYSGGGIFHIFGGGGSFRAEAGGSIEKN